MTDEDGPAKRVREIRKAVSGYRRAQIYISFARLGIGPALAEEPLGLADLAHACNADLDALERYSRAAIAFDLLQEDGDGRLALTETARAAFSPASEQSIANLMRLEGAFYERWGRLADAVRTGQRPPENRAQEDDPGWVRMFTLALFDNARQTAPAVAAAVTQAIPEPGEHPLRVIDIGGGHGAYALALAEHRSDVDAIVFDLPPVIKVTSEIVAASPVSDRVRAVAGDFHQDPLGGRCDVALLFGVLHGETPENAKNLLETVYRVLAPGGLLLIRSHGQSSREPTAGERELVDLHMLLSTEGGEVRRQQDTSSLVVQAGFVERSPVVIPDPGSGQLLVFQRPS